MVIRPGGEYGGRPLHFIWLLDCSGSMKVDNKIQTLNYAIREAIPAMRDEAAKNPEARIIVRAIKFSNGAQWHMATETPLNEFRWTDLEAEGETDMGKAFSLLAEELRTFPTVGRYLPPVLVLITDGEPTDDWRGPLQQLLATPWAQHAVRIAIAVGSEAKLEPLERFINNPERRPVRADDPDSLVRQIKWASTTVSDTTQGKPPTPPPAAQAGGSGSVF
jgi:uncharacterized protein YegL